MRKRVSCASWAMLVAFGLAAPVLADGPFTGVRGKSETTEEIMARQAKAPARPVRDHELPLRYPDRKNLPDAPGAQAVASWPPDAAKKPVAPGPLAAQTVSTQFTGATLSETGSYPPDTMGAVGPTQFFVFVNGRLRTFTKAGVADGVINADPDVFFSSVISTNSGTFTSDPRVRYDRLTARWFLIIIDVPAGTGAVANKVLVAVSDTSTITGSTVWSFYSFKPEASAFVDYPTLGIDANALYIGGNIFTLAGSFSTTTGYVVNKASLLAGTLSYSRFQFLASSGSAGPFTPQGVDNDDPAATEGYFVGVDNLAYSLLKVVRVTNPGGASPSVTQLSVTVPTTRAPIAVPSLGGATSLDALDDRLFAATLKKGSIWTAHNIQMTTACAGSTSGGRNGARWYQINNLAATPALAQSGSVCDAAATSPLSFWIPSIAASGQGHAALGFSSAGAAARVNAATVGRLSGDTAGTMQVPATISDMNYTASSTAYSTGYDRWGDYSYVSLDPLDDMTLWTVQEFCDAANSYGVRVAKLLAPPPATPTGALTLAPNTASQVVAVTGTSTSGSGFYDPGANLASPALPFTHISATITPSTGITINSVTYTDPTHVSLNVTTVAAAAGARTLRITNPDGQFVETTITVGALPVELQQFAVE